MYFSDAQMSLSGIQSLKGIFENSEISIGDMVTVRTERQLISL